MPKGVELSSSKTALLSPKPDPAAKSRGKGEREFARVLKKAKPEPQTTEQEPVKPAKAKAKPQPEAKPVDAEQPVDVADAVDPGTTKSADQSEPVAEEAAIELPVEPVIVPELDEDIDTPVPTPDADLLAVLEQVVVNAPVSAPIDQATAELSKCEIPERPESPMLVQPTLSRAHEPAPTEKPEPVKTTNPLVSPIVVDVPEEPVGKFELGKDWELRNDLPGKPQVAKAVMPKEQQPVAKVAEAPVLDDGAALLADQQPDQQPDTDAQPQQQQTADLPHDVVAKIVPQHDSAASLPDAPAIVEAPVAKTTAPAPTAQPQPAPQPPVRPDAEFAANNHDRLVSSVRTQLLPNGGTMTLRLDPVDLGTVEVTVRMVDGAMTASFATSNDQATRLLSHSLGQLKAALETQGVSVEKLHVEQSSRDQQSSNDDSQRRESQQQQQDAARREQERRELLNRMWRRLRLGSDPLDMVA